MKVKVLLVDDSPTVRAVLKRVFALHSEFTVIAEAADGQEALVKLFKFQPDVILMDLEMPGMDGLEAIEQIMRLRPTPILVLSSRANRNLSTTVFEAVRRGALDVVAKPESPEAWHELSEKIPELVRTAAQWSKTTRRPRATSDLPRVPPRRIELLLVGASTGGPGALRMFLANLPGDFQVPIAVVQHIAPGFEEGLARWLSDETKWDAKVLKEKEKLTPKTVRLAPAGAHLLVESEGSLSLDVVLPPRNGHRPSVDVLFESALKFRPKNTAAVLLSGMGDDGARGLLALKTGGALTAVQDEASSAVFGMPRQALELGAAEVALPPEDLARFIEKMWRGSQ